MIPDEARMSIPSQQTSSGTIETIVVPRSSDIGGFEVRRALPSAQRRTVGPFVFLDEFGPTVFDAGTGLDVRPHPHIGLSTLSYLYEGEIVHRDGKGHVQTISPGEVNWMTAGRGIVHSERTDPARRKQAHGLSGLQTWLALPREHEETDPGFSHYARDPAATLEGEGVKARVVAGSLFGKTSSVRTFSPLFLVDLALDAGARIALSAEYVERAAYITSGEIEIEGQAHGPGRLLVFAAGKPVVLRACTQARFALLGGEPLDGPRFVWWNFVSSRKERIEQAREEWMRNRFDQTLPGEESEYIPAPERKVL
ncbi:Pirin-related protein [plant metagenome]|uniref:Pirin-related protein n=1 Tax=plant metagenome TaxID=1297885 RepID=A0A484RIA7_9ZZZZ